MCCIWSFKTIIVNSSYNVKDYCRLQWEFVWYDMLCMYNNVDKNYDVIIPYTHNTAHVIILFLPLDLYTTLFTLHSTITYYARVMHFPSAFHYTCICLLTLHNCV